MGISISNQLLGSTGLSVGLGLSRGNGLSFGGFAGGPALYLPFALTGTLDPRVTFSRPSLATMYDSTGKLVYAPNNLALQSTTFANAAWTKVNATVTSGVADPVGGTAACTVTATAANGQIYQIVSMTGNVTSSFWVRRRTGTGDVNLRGIAGGAGVTMSLTSSWQRFSITGAAAGSAYSYIVIVTSGDAIDVAFAQLEAVTYQTTPSTYNATTSAAYYGPRFDYNPATLVARGLLIEEARTNSNLYSEDLSNAWWTKSGASVSGGNTAPDGTTNAYNLVESTANSTHSISRALAVSATNAAVYTLSFYVKTAGRTRARLYIYGFNNYTSILDFSTKSVVSASGGTSPVVTFTDINNSYIRVTITDTTTFSELQFDSISLVSTGTTFSYTGDGVSGMILWGFQRELGSFATSYIPTAASAVARSGDSVTMTGTNFSSWYNQTQGTFVANVAGNYSGNTSIFMVNSTGSNGVFASGITGGFALAVQSYPAGNILNVTNPGGGGTFSKMGLAYKSGDSGFSRDGSAVTTSSNSNAMIVGTSLQLGQDYFSGSPLGQTWIASLAYYNTRLPNATLQSLTLPVIADYYFLVTGDGDQLTDASGNPLYTQPLYL